MMTNVEFRIDKNGNWFYLGNMVNEKELVCFLSAFLRRDDDGSYFLLFDKERKDIIVEDAPFVVAECYRAGDGQEQVLSFRTCTDRIITLDDGAKIVKKIEEKQERYYIIFGENMEARLSKLVVYDLFDLVEYEHDCANGICGVWSSNNFFLLR